MIIKLKKEIELSNLEFNNLKILGIISMFI